MKSFLGYHMGPPEIAEPDSATDEHCYRLLAAKAIRQAVLDIHASANTKRSRRCVDYGVMVENNRRSAYHWVNGGDCCLPFALCCEALGIDPEWGRDLVLRGGDQVINDLRKAY